MSTQKDKLRVLNAQATARRNRIGREISEGVIKALYDRFPLDFDENPFKNAYRAGCREVIEFLEQCRRDQHVSTDDG